MVELSLRNCLSIEDNQNIQLSNEHLADKASRHPPGYEAIPVPISSRYRNRKRPSVATA